MLDDSRLRALMRMAQAGDARAYIELLTAVAPRLRQIILNQRRSLQAADIEDLVQDVLLSLHAVRSTYDPERPFMPWLLAITRNRIADRARRHARRGAHEVQVEQWPVTFSENSTNTDSDSYGDSEALRHAVERLPAGQRTAIELVKLRELSLKEAAAVTGTSIGALKVSVHRAMVTLRKSIRKS